VWERPGERLAVGAGVVHHFDGGSRSPRAVRHARGFHAFREAGRTMSGPQATRWFCTSTARVESVTSSIGRDHIPALPVRLASSRPLCGRRRAGV
jgi:hypothetical protein